NEDPKVTGRSRSYAPGGRAHQDDADTRNFIETHNVTKVTRKPVAGSGEESADLLPDDEVGRP
ncbi:MAG TPA: hypothetical protein VMF03_20800, partial [Steroidobacteraceae bacterium]|nr:hypothetical protein [Steroidobacteraceae bacterium]